MSLDVSCDHSQSSLDITYVTVCAHSWSKTRLVYFFRIKVVDYSMVGIAKNKEERKKMKEEKKKLSRRKKKESKIEQEKDQELKELAASEDQEERTKIHTEIVQQIFLIYFRILKHEVVGTSMSDRD